MNYVTVNRLDGSRVLVILCDSDMRDFSLSFEQLSLNDSHSRKIILRLTRLACKKSGIEVKGRKIGVEALKMDDGCYLLVTVKSPLIRYKPKHKAMVCYSFERESFLNAVEALYRSGFICAKNAAYEYGGRYYLIFSYPKAPLSLRKILSEFSDKRGGAILCAKIKEHGNLICPQNAVETIGRHLV